jgi:hypothetical protein
MDLRNLLDYEEWERRESGYISEKLYVLLRTESFSSF